MCGLLLVSRVIISVVQCFPLSLSHHFHFQLTELISLSPVYRKLLVSRVIISFVQYFPLSLSHHFHFHFQLTELISLSSLWKITCVSSHPSCPVFSFPQQLPRTNSLPDIYAISANISSGPGSLIEKSKIEKIFLACFLCSFAFICCYDTVPSLN